ncbi:hypothetical protein HG531_013024 [Fusarium graminearum]|nr:hypothetical protein HG531_013024 [Fusarium graminearum]
MSEEWPLKLIIDGSVLLVLAGRLGLGLLSLLLAVLTGSSILRSGSVLDIALDSLAVNAFNIRVRGGNTGAEVLVPTLSGLLDFIALLINNTRLCFILGLELNLALESLHLLRVKEVTILVAILDLFLLSNNTMLYMGLVEREVVQRPAKNRSTDFIVETLEGSVGVVVATALPAKNSNSLEDNPDGNSDARRPPDDGVTKEVDLGVLATPEVDTTAEDGPGLRARIPSISETLLGDSTSSLFLDNLDSEEIVGITLKSLITIGGNFILPVGLSDRGANVM